MNWEGLEKELSSVCAFDFHTGLLLFEGWMRMMPQVCLTG